MSESRHRDRAGIKPKEKSKESLYRTKWLMAHNRLHSLVHDSSASPQAEWRGYLRDLRSSEAVAKTQG